MNKEQLFKTDLSYRTYRILHLAHKYGWILKRDDREKFEFEDNEGTILHVNYASLHFTTALEHPKWGKTILTRRGNLTQKLCESIFRNPRTHMPKKIKSEYKTQL